MPATRPPDIRAPHPRPVLHAAVVDGGARLPRPLTRLIARDREVASVAALLREPGIRLLTLTGPGGVGKTRIAIAAATEVADDVRDGAVFVDLAPVSDPQLVFDTIAGALGLRAVGVQPLSERVLDVLSEKRLLLVLDNFEQVVTAGPRLLDLLGACPDVKLLVTSRIVLRLSGEREFPVAPLPTGASTAAGDDGASGAVRLFAERAQASRPDFRLTAETLPVVAEIVGRVDGLPLAIELAAARIKVLPPVALLQRMEQRLPLLKGGARDLPLRQQTMRDTIAWSYDLLDDAEQVLFRRLGVFVGRFTLGAAEAIGSVPADAADGRRPHPPISAIDGIMALIDHSLLQQGAGPEDEPRYQMLETVREFAWEQLTASGEAAAVRGAHAAWCLGLVEEAEPLLWGAGQVGWIDRLDRDNDNVRAALHWSLSQDDIETATNLGASLWRFWARKGRLGEGRSLLAGILAHTPSPAPRAARCSALTGAGVLAALQGDYDEAIRHAEEALAGWRQLGDRRGIARSLLCLATVARYRDDYAGAESLGHESLAAFRAVDDRWGVGHVLSHLGMVARVQGNRAAGTACYDEALAHLRAIGDESGIFEVVLELGKGACDDGDLALATTRFEECLALATTMGDGAGRGAALTELGVVAQRLGDFDRASGLFQDASVLAQESGDRRQVAYLAAHLGDVHFATGGVGSAAARYAEALGLFLPMGNRVGVAHCLESLARCATSRGRTSSAVRLLGSCAALYGALGATPPPDGDPAADAASLEPRLAPADFARAWDGGRALSLAEAAAEALALAADLAGEAHAGAPPDALTEAKAGPAGPSPASATESSSPAARLGLTPREVEVLRLLAEGMSDRDIAAALSISERTAGNHVQHAMQKIGVESRTAAAVFAVRHGLG